MARLILEMVPPGATLQDAGRTGWLAAGVAPSGPLDALAHEAANVAVGNEPRAATLEIPLGPLRARAEGEIVVSLDGAPPILWPNGSAIHVPHVDRAVRYLAVAGGFDVPLVMGSRSTLLVANLGGWQGRALHAGDALPVTAPSPSRALGREGAHPDLGLPSVLFVWPGPHLARLPEGALARWLEGTWSVSPRSDRVGTRLEGPKIARREDDRAAPAPMVRGAVQITTDGTPIVFGPDHPVTGGYPVIAVLTGESQSRLARLRPNRPVRFALAST